MLGFNPVKNLSFLLVLFALALTYSSCKKEQRAQKMPESINNYVYAYTSGVISNSSIIKVRFNGKVSESRPCRFCFLFSPSVAGTASWEDDNTLVFEPEEPWESNTTYVATVSLSKLFTKLPSEIRRFEFDFRIRAMNFRY